MEQIAYNATMEAKMFIQRYEPILIFSLMALALVAIYFVYHIAFVEVENE